jgi:quinoprotein glucose dehydrogenase
MTKFLIGLASMACLLFLALQVPNPNTEWPEYLGGPERNHYSALSQINTQNVPQLKPAWEYHTKDTSGQMQCNPIIVNGVLYATTASVQVFALEAATGKEIWRFKDASDATWFNTNRGVVYAEVGGNPRIFFSVGPWLYCLDAKTGKPVDGFGDKGKISLKTGLGKDAEKKFVVATTPGTVFENLLIMGSRLSERGDAAMGYIRAYDLQTGALVWLFKTIPDPGEYGADTWPKVQDASIGGANCWTGMAVDRKRGIVYAPTGSATFDFYGGKRHGQNLFANCLLALDAKTGKRIWHQQLVHHDIWDRDLPSPPTLLSVRHEGKKVDAVAQTTKHGYVFLFDRENGKPLFPIEEEKVPESDLIGEKAWPTQPRPKIPAPFVRQRFTIDDINPHSEDKAELRTRFLTTRSDHMYTPPSVQGTIILPGFDGGAEWGGSAADPNGILYFNANEMPWILTMTEVSKSNSQLSAGEQAYLNYCGACHGKDRKGDASGAFPNLLGIENRRNKEFVSNVIYTGKGMMPGFPNLSKKDKAAIVDFLFGEKGKASKVKKQSGAIASGEMPYNFTGYNRFLDKKGYPAIAPPWGKLIALDLNTGEYRWQVPLGEFKELSDKGIAPTGTENYGGPLVTAGNVLFIGASKDEKFRAFNVNSGKELWQYQLPAGGYATPSTYEVNGKQYVVIACGGAKMGTKKGDSYVAFALP